MECKGLWLTAEILRDTRLNSNEKILLAEIHNLSQMGECFASNGHFAEVLGLSKTRITHLLTNLNRLNLIAVTLTYKTGTKVIDKRLITPMVENDHTYGQKQPYPMVKNDHTPMVENDQGNKQVFKKQVKKQIKDKNIYEQEFETLWNIYPNKKGRDKAEQSYIKARKEKIEYETIKNGLDNYCLYVESQQTEKRFIKHGSTWFNQRSWQDDYTMPKKRVTSFLDFYEHEFGGITNEPRGNRQVIDDNPNLLPHAAQEYF